MPKDLNQIKGDFNPEDIRVYRKLISSITKDGTVLELGCYEGKAICSIAEQIKNKNLNVTVVDPSFEEKEVLSNFEKNTKSFGPDKIKIISGDTIESSIHIEDQSIDLLFLNKNFDSKLLYEDFNTYLPKLKKSGLIVGYNVSQSSVTKALHDLNLLQWIKRDADLWWINKSDLLENNGNVTVEISTKDRYDSLYQTVLCIANQTVTPTNILIFDDSKNKVDLRNILKWQYLFELLNDRHIEIYFLLTNNGQNRNHQIAKELCISQFIWRNDDDIIFGNTVLEELLISMMDKNITAVAPLVVTPGTDFNSHQCSSMLSDLMRKPNSQMVNPNKNFSIGLTPAEHLHCTFLYRRNTTASYDLRLSRVGHREETIFTYRIHDQGGTLMINNNAKVYHLKENNGGIRSQEYNDGMFHDDEKLYGTEVKYLKAMNEIRGKNIFYLDDGIGDHYSFKKIFKDYIKGQSIIFCVFPEVFADLDKELVTIKSLAEGQKYIKENFKFATYDDFAIYKYMMHFNWKSSTNEAYKMLYIPRVERTNKKINQTNE